ncbi:protein kinase C-binding protein NELL2 [Bactrocera oleae]|uniref:protein kinase C-binding protein NELL2 n=1 Tax=Bactrocera oleae TaxID=104688 RepID=UPI00387EE7A5
MFQIKIILLLPFVSTLIQAEKHSCTKQGKAGETIQICCAGYVGNGTHCTAFCTNGCINGKCIAAEHCECNEGFAKKRGRQCEPITANSQQQLCHERCINGTCSDGLCTCGQGWRLQQNKSADICVPQRGNSLSNSSDSCVNGYCSAPGNCSCFAGFELLPGNRQECVPSMSDISLSKFLATWPQYHSEIIIATITLIFVLLAIYYLFYRIYRLETKKGNVELNCETNKLVSLKVVN